MNIAENLRPFVKGEVDDSEETLKKYSRDTSIFEQKPSVVVSPKTIEDVRAVVAFVHDARSHGSDMSVTARSAGTDMTGGPLTNSIVLSFTPHMNRLLDARGDEATVEPGMYYRDFEKAVLNKTGGILPSYPASRELCALGGMLANNSGGELTLRYGKTSKYVKELTCVLSDGSTVRIKPLNQEELEAKKLLQTLEGEIYRKIDGLISANKGVIEEARPRVTKNSAGYALWDVRHDGLFDLTRLIVGSQGTLAIITKAKVGLVKTKKYKAMLVMYIADLHSLPAIVKKVLAHEPESFESFDDKTFALAIRFLPAMLRQMGLWSAIKLGFAFIPDVFAAWRGGIPKLILMAEFAEDSAEEALEKVRLTKASLTGEPLRMHIARSEAASEKYWKVRRESFALLRKNIHGRYAAPFIDDLVVDPKVLPEFLPELTKLTEGHRFIYTIAGHVGNGNFHIIPLVEMAKPEARQEILELMPKVCALVGKYHGSLSGEHNDGILRTPYLHFQFSEPMLALFEQVKDIFDPSGVFNPGKKVRGSTETFEKLMIHHV